jgi:hypothetical protein
MRSDGTETHDHTVHRKQYPQQNRGSRIMTKRIGDGSEVYLEQQDNTRKEHQQRNLMQTMGVRINTDLFPEGYSLTDGVHK